MAQSNCDPPKRSSPNVRPTEDEIYEALRAWLCAILPEDYAIYKAQLNRAPPPLGPFIQMLIVTRERYATNGHQYSPGANIVTQPMLLTTQLSIYRDGAGDAAALLSTLWRDAQATGWFRGNFPCASPVRASSPRQNVWIDGSAQYVDGWNLDLTLDVQTRTVIPSKSAVALTTKTEAADRVSMKEIKPYE